MEPVKPKRRDRLPVGADWRYEIKLDGFRGLLHVEDGRGYFLSKNVNRMERFQSLADTLAAVLKVKSAILDGEIIAVRQERADFYALMFGRGRAEYAAFDLLWLNGRDLQGQPYRRHRAAPRFASSSSGRTRSATWTTTSRRNCSKPRYAWTWKA